MTSAASALPRSPESSAALPEWDLTDLYPGMGSAAVAADLAKADADCRAFAEAWRGRLAELAAGPDAGAKLAEAVRQYEALEELLGRLISYAGLIYAGDNSDPARAKFYGDVQEQVTNASSHLLFFDGRDSRQRDQARRLIAHYEGRVKPILVAGAYLDLMQAWRRPVYFDQHGRLTRQFGVTQVPALVSQDGARLRIDELETTQ